MKHFYGILLILMPVFLTIMPAQAQTTLAAGDIAIIGYNYDAAPQELSIVTLVPITAGTTIFIADYGYEGSAFVANTLAHNNEGSIEWLTTGSIAAGTVFRIQMASTNAGTTVTGLPGTLTIRGWAQVFGAGAVSATNTPSAAGGESWFIYQGTAYNAPSQFVFGWANWASTTFGSANGWVLPPQTVGTNTQVSQLPAQLTNGSTARSLAWFTANGGKHGDNNVYTGIRTGTKAQLLSAIGNVTNWSTDETTVYDISPGGTNFPGVAPQFTVNGSSLPVTWGPVQANPLQNNIWLSWTTYTEPGNHYFTIQHSVDGSHWTVLQTVPARGNDAMGANYQYTHTTPAWGTNYYRLLQTDYNGRTSYSKTVTAVIAATSQVRLYPNPGKGIFFVERKESGKARLSVIDRLGRVVWQQTVFNVRETIHVAHLPPGSYHVRINSKAQNFHLPLSIQ